MSNDLKIQMLKDHPTGWRKACVLMTSIEELGNREVTPEFYRVLEGSGPKPKSTTKSASK